jgi:oxygen-dependent protoporphyrinogen oxidase
MAEPRRIVVVGGGIAGLSAAHAALARAREKGAPVTVTVLERSPRFGGNVVTERASGYVLDAGPDSWVVTKPQASALARELGLEGQLISTNPNNRRYYIAWGDRLHPVPEGLVLGVPTRIAPLVKTSLFSWGGKMRMGLEPFVKRRPFDGDDDEAIGDFATRRLGREAAERLVAPLLGGISGGDASDISVRAAFPQLVAMEREHGSLVRGMHEARKARLKAAKAAASNGGGGGAGKEASAFVSLKDGVGALPDALVARLREQGAVLRSAAAVDAIEREAGRWTVHVAGGERLEADGVVMAVPGHDAARLLGSLDDGVAGALTGIAYGSTATVFLGYRRADVSHPLDGVGFVVPRASGRPILAGTWVSSKWDGRAPEGHVLLRAFFGGEWGKGVLAESDEGLVAIARAQLGSLMGLDAEPAMTKVFRFARGSAQMKVGHMAMMRGMRETLARVAPGLLVAGGGYDGVGIPDCVRQGNEAGRAMVDGP